MEHEIPQGMVIVSKEEFYKVLFAEKRDIMPSVRFPYHTTWELRDRTLWGWSYPGWKNTGEKSVYAIYPTTRKETKE